MNATLSKSFNFEAGHCLPRVPEGHKCKRPHGHSYRLTVQVHGPVDPATGFVIDFGVLSAAVRPVIDQLDHQNLNEIAGLENPTSENICHWLWQRIKPAVPQLSAIILQESPNNVCEYRGD